MKDEDRSRDDVFAELRRLRSRVAELESGTGGRDHAVGSLEHQYHELIQENRDGYARLNMDGSFVLCNPAYCAMLGYTQEELRSKAYADITPDRWRATDEASMKQMLEEGSCDRYEKEYRRRDGTIFPVELQSYLVRDAEGNATGMWSFVRDLTRQKEAERAMAAQYNLLRVAGKTVRFGGWSVDVATGRCTWSDVVADIHGMPPGYAPRAEEGIGFYAPEWREKITEVFTRCLKQGIPFDEEMEILNRAGDRVWVRTVGEAVKDERERIVQVEGSFQDITDRKQAEARLLESEKFAAIGRVSAGIAHEINNPLAAIRSSTELIRRTLEGDEGAMPDAAPRLLERVDKVLRNVDRCKGVAESLMGYARRGTGDYQPVNVVKALRDELNAVRESAGDAGERILRIAEPPTLESLLAMPGAGGEMDRAPAESAETSFPVRARPGQFEQVFQNLLMNALHATAAGGRVFVSHRTVDGGIEVTVADSGEGMAEQDIPRVFEPFFTTKQPGEGTGLGLYMTRRIVESADGRIDCESVKDRGTLIRVWLPGFSEKIRSEESG